MSKMNDGVKVLKGQLEVARRCIIARHAALEKLETELDEGPTVDCDGAFNDYCDTATRNIDLVSSIAESADHEEANVLLLSGALILCKTIAKDQDNLWSFYLKLCTQNCDFNVETQFEESVGD